MASRLTPCPSCTRHVKVGPPACPFCGGEVPVDVPARAVKLAHGKTLTRAVLAFAGAAAVTGCSSSKATEPKDAAVDHGGPAPAYGGPIGLDGDTFGEAEALYGAFVDAAEFEDSGDEDAGDDKESDAAADAGQEMAAYGGFVNPDSGK